MENVIAGEAVLPERRSLKKSVGGCIAVCDRK